MKISAKTDYACRAILELALHWPNPYPLQIQAVAQHQHIPIKFLTHILIELKQLGYVRSVRGKKGGYLLAKPPREIKLSELVRNFADIEVLSVKAHAESKTHNALESIWHETSALLLNFMNNITFEELIKKQKSIAEVPMYTI